jgi:DNA repair exonuclease SbcCD ATPase subunit
MGTLTLSVFEIIFLFVCAIMVGVVIHFFIVTRRSLNKSFKDAKKARGLDEWKLKYFNDIEIKDKELDELKRKHLEESENSKIYQMEVEELRRQQKKLTSELESLREMKTQMQGAPVATKTDYFEQLRLAQQSLIDHNEKISQLLDQVDVIKETEEKSQEIQRNNEELSDQIKDLKYMLDEKESEINQIRQKEHLTKEMNSMLDSAYSEFNVLQTKMKKLESQLTSSKMVNIEYEDLKESHYKMSRDYDDAKSKVAHYMQENQALQIQLNKTEDKLSEANLQRQQLQKKVAYLDELNRDLQQMSDANKKLEGQLRRMGELESMLNLVEEERDKLKDQKES